MGQRRRNVGWGSEKEIVIMLIIKMYILAAGGNSAADLWKKFASKKCKRPRVKILSHAGSERGNSTEILCLFWLPF